MASREALYSRPSLRFPFATGSHCIEFDVLRIWVKVRNLRYANCYLYALYAYRIFQPTLRAPALVFIGKWGATAPFDAHK